MRAAEPGRFSGTAIANRSSPPDPSGPDSRPFADDAFAAGSRPAWWRSRARTPAGRFVVAALLFLVALAARLPVDQLVPNRLPFITFYPSLAAAPLLTGFWPTIALLVAFALTGAYWVAPFDADPVVFRLVAAGLFLTSGGILVALVGRLSQIHAGLARREEARILVNQELRHRLKNILGVVDAVIQQSARRALATDDLGAVLSGRIHAIAAAQELALGDSAVTGIGLRDLVEVTLKPLAPSAERLRLSGSPVTLPGDRTTPFALVLHELATNALKYGAWSTAAVAGLDMPCVEISWQVDGRKHLLFLWREPLAAPSPSREGFGSALIRRALTDASVAHTIGEDGVTCRIDLPLAT